MRPTLRSWIESTIQRESAKSTDGRCLLQTIAHALVQYRALEKKPVRTTNDEKPVDRLLKQIEALIERGFTIRKHLPLLTKGVQDEWLGKRWLFAHEKWLATSPQWTCVVSSRIGRLGRQLDAWPSILERLVMATRAAGRILMSVKSTTTSPLIQPVLRQLGPELGLGQIIVDPSEHCRQDVTDWLLHLLKASDRRAGDDLRVTAGTIHLSPLVRQEAYSPNDALASYPIQDRIAVCWGHWICALKLRPGGTIAALLDLRLSDTRFPLGSVSVLLPGISHSWLDRGAVGWHLLPNGQGKPGRPHEFGCRGKTRHAPSPRVQLTFPYGLFGRNRDRKPGDGEVEFLAHCVRGLHGGVSVDAMDNCVIDAWLRGCPDEESALATLITIFSSGRLRGGSKLTRGSQPCVSFSAVPLDDLLSRRVYQSHLGRWDWEPFGLLIKRVALENVGARPVIYGDPSEFESLASDDRPFFQPAKRRNSRRPYQDWRHESEWRLMGDLRLNDLPTSAVHAFVQLQHQAVALAQRISWPVIWLKEDRIVELPTTRARRRGTLVRISRN